jgi:hypothetical protein
MKSGRPDISCEFYNSKGVYKLMKTLIIVYKETYDVEIECYNLENSNENEFIVLLEEEDGNIEHDGSQFDIINHQLTCPPDNDRFKNIKEQFLKIHLTDLQIEFDKADRDRKMAEVRALDLKKEIESLKEKSKNDKPDN